MKLKHETPQNCHIGIVTKLKYCSNLIACVPVDDGVNGPDEGGPGLVYLLMRE
jgi:hypothetical protein